MRHGQSDIGAKCAAMKDLASKAVAAGMSSGACHVEALRCQDAAVEQSWYLVQCKPRQDDRAEEHLSRQGYVCFRPRHVCERRIRGRLQKGIESLFPGYLFVQLSDQDNWAPLRSTRGVSRLVGFGGYPISVPAKLIEELKQREEILTVPMLESGHRVRITQGCFAELDAIFLSMDGDERVVLLLNLLNRQQRISVPLVSIAKV